MRQLVLSLTALATLLLGWLGAGACPPARADADPASDVLLTANVFYPYDPPVSSSLQAALGGEVTAARKAGFPVKVALIATPIDLGAIPQLFGKPQQYARFLDQEISFASKVPVLVVMPDGYGSAGLPNAASAAVAVLRKPSARAGDALTDAAITAVRKLAAAAGHPLPAGPIGSAPPSSGGGTAVPLAIVIAVCLGLAAGILAIRRRRAWATTRDQRRRV